MFFTIGGAVLLGLGIFGWIHPTRDPLPGQELTNVKTLAIGGVLFVAGIIWWKKSNEWI